MAASTHVAGLWYHSAVVSAQNSGFTVWLTGLSGAGKTTIGHAVAAELEQRGLHVEVLDGDVVRTHLSKGVLARGPRHEHRADRLGRLAPHPARRGRRRRRDLPYDATRKRVAPSSRSRPLRRGLGEGTLEECARRDVKGLYAKAFAGEITQFTGVDDPYEEPDDAEVVADTVALSPDESVALVMAELERLDSAGGYAGFGAPLSS